MKEKILGKDGNEVLLNSYPLEIRHTDTQITEVVIKKGDDVLVVKPNYVVSSIPITEFLNLLVPHVPSEIKEAASELRFRSHVSLFLILNKQQVFPDQWVYFPETHIPFGRIMEPKNFSRKLAPPEKTSLLVEFFCWKGDEIWEADRRNL